MFGWLLTLFILVPMAELMLLLRLGDLIGLVPTLSIIVCTGVIGASLARWQGLITMRRVQTEFQAGRLPGDALVDGLLILVAGALLLTPGLMTDACGFLLLIPPGRALLRRRVMAAFRRRVRTGDGVVLDAQWERDDD
jgi:UPF0716 protein FxsA